MSSAMTPTACCWTPAIASATSGSDASRKSAFQASRCSSTKDRNASMPPRSRSSPVAPVSAFACSLRKISVACASTSSACSSRLDAKCS